MQAFDHLLSLELLVPVTGEPTSLSAGRHQLREYTTVQLVLSGEQITSCVQDYPNCPTDLVRWASSQAIA